MKAKKFLKSRHMTNSRPYERTMIKRENMGHCSMHFQSPPPYTTLVGPFARTVLLFAYYVLLTLRLAIIPNFPTVIDAVSSANPVSAADFTPWALGVISAPMKATFHK